MARRKNSTALFEVIHAGKLDRRPASEAMKTPRWWFKGREKGDPGSTPVPVSTPDPTANVTAATLFRTRQRSAEALPVPTWSPPPAPEPASESAADTAPVRTENAVADVVAAPMAFALASVPAAIDAPVAAAPASAAPPVDTAPTPLIVRIDDGPVAANAASNAGHARETRTFGSRSGMQVAFDGDRQEVTLKMRYTAALVTAFSVLVVVGLAYVLGRRMSEGPPQAKAGEAAASSAQLKKGPAQPGAMDVSQRSTRSATPRSADGTAGNAPARAVDRNPVAAGNGPVEAPMTSYGSAERTVNLNYLLIQSYPPDMKQTAQEVRDYFLKNQIPCTVEKDLARIRTNKGWYGVVGTLGFQQNFGSDPEYQAYVKAIQQVAARYPVKSKLDKVQPMAFKWLD